MKIWNDDEVKSLFEEVENCKKNQKALQEAFCAHAKKYSRQANSVRNYYYMEVENLKSDTQRCARLGLDMKNHLKTHFVTFEKKQEEELFEKIESLTKNGQSVRSACLTLSGGDLSKMTRFQNKYQNMKKKQKGEIVQFRKERTLSDAEINSLFLGLVRLIKKTAFEQVGEESNQLLKKAYVDLNKKDKEISILKEDFENLKKQNKELLVKLEKNRKNALKMQFGKKRNENSQKDESC